MNSPTSLWAFALDVQKTQQQFAAQEVAEDNRPKWQIELDEREAAELARSQQRKDEHFDRLASD